MSLKGKEFDAFIRGKIQDLPVSNSAGDWAAFENALDEANQQTITEDADFDTFIRASAENWHAPYNANHWNLMASQLHIIEIRKKAVIEAKILEVTAVLLLAFTFFTIPGLWMQYPEKVPSGNMPAQHQTSYASNNTLMPAKKSESTFSSSYSTGKPGRPVQQSSLMMSHELSGMLTKDESARQTAHPFFSQNLSTAWVTANDTSQDFNVRHAGLTETPTEASNKENLIQNTIPVHLLPGISNTPASEWAQIFPLKYARHREPITWYLSAYANADINLINTPFDKLYSIASYTKEALNNSYGIHVSRKTGNAEVETGLGYAARIYQPEIITEAFGHFGSHYFEKSLQKISFDIAFLPATIKFHFIDQPTWSAYLMGNVSLNLIMNASYDIKEVLVQGRPAPGRFTPDEARLDEKPFTEGLLNGGKFSENYFITVGFGFGIQKQIFEGFSMYLQPSYNRHILSQHIGIGPNKDKIHTSGIQMGVRAQLFK
jgi:hypothetical protein